MVRPLVVLGPTASGKTSLGLELAKRLDGEVISADAMAVYKEMSVGTAKPTAAELASVPHHCVDVASVTDSFHLSDFQELAQKALAEIEQRGKLPIIVGGTGLYVRSIVDDLELPPADPEVRQKLDDTFSTEELFEKLNDFDPQAASKIEPTNRRRLLRAMEVVEISGRPFSSYGPGMEAYPETNFVQVGLEIDRELMDERIEQRFWKQIEEGFVEEVKSLEEFELSKTAAQALGYAELARHIAGELTVEEAIHEAVLRTRRFARRQQRWFRRDPRIKWLESQDDSLVDLVVDHWQSQNQT